MNKRLMRIETLRGAINRIETDDIEVFEFGQRPQDLLEHVLQLMPKAAAERGVWPIEQTEDFEDALEEALLTILKEKIERLLKGERELIMRLVAKLLGSLGYGPQGQELLRKEGLWR